LNKIRIVLAEDHHVVRAGLVALLAREADLKIVGQAARGDAILDVVGRYKPDVLVLDARMPGHKVLETAKRLRLDHPAVKVLVLSQYNQREYVVGLLKEGAKGYVLKDDAPDMLVNAIHAVAAGRDYVSPRVSGVLAQSIRKEASVARTNLSRRENDVLKQLCQGKTNRDIGEALSISEQTVKNHVQRIFRKLDVSSRVDAVLWAIEHGACGSAENPTPPPDAL
jgi:DNA-binding NarL/FixJ family response regulator